MTNYEKIKNMNIEEMAKILNYQWDLGEIYCNSDCGISVDEIAEDSAPCNKCIERWLNEEAKQT